MSINLADYAELLEDLSPHSQEALNATWHDATKVFSPRGLDNYLKGAAAIRGLGRGRLAGRDLDRGCAAGGQGGRRGRGRRPRHRLADAGLENLGCGDRTAARHRADRRPPPGRCAAVPQVPAVHQHPDRAGAARRAADAGQAGSAVPAADAGRPAALGDVGRARAPHQLRRADQAISAWSRKSRWRCCRRSARARCWWTCSGASTCICARCGRATSSCARLRATSRSREGYRPYIEDYLLHLPDAFDDFAPEGHEPVSGLELYRATAAHCAAHMVETRQPISAEALNPLQMAVISVIEDARVEALAIRRFPGLKQLWSKLHTATPEMNASVGDYLNRLARALLDDSYAGQRSLDRRRPRAVRRRRQDQARQQPHVVGNRRAAGAQPRAEDASPSTRAPTCSPRPTATTTATSGNSRSSISTRPPAPATNPSSRCASTSA